MTPITKKPSTGFQRYERTGLFAGVRRPLAHGFFLRLSFFSQAPFAVVRSEGFVQGVAYEEHDYRER